MVQPLTGQLQLTDPLDFEKIKDFRIRIKAQDHGIPPRSTNMTLVIHVSDFNDNAPVFETTSYEAEVAENSPLMTAVLKVKARDADSRENGKVLYRITNGSSAFGIDEKTGMIYVNENIDREVQSIYSIIVTAQDQGEPSLSSSVPVRIHITDVNDNAPSCNSVATMVVPLDSTPATTVGTVVITDRDSGLNGTVVYRSQQSHPLFVVKSNGDVQLRRPLTDSDPTDIRLSIIASDQGTPRKSTVCHVQIRIGRGTSAVKIVEPFESVFLGCPGLFIVQLFNIDSSSGTICLENKLDFEKEISHQLTVAAIDQSKSCFPWLILAVEKQQRYSLKFLIWEDCQVSIQQRSMSFTTKRRNISPPMFCLQLTIGYDGSMSPDIH
ncbi:hypothetical protein ANCCAN_21108 [Ancylostoma caninum]|uniref:Cadherin domain-containing protein n=1 Tax=Ancylostoma caninum TaxID=29170 RepID=A0A368FQG7_ANCCA|nr:hypothetical protein ANCCAN_21108 [Ancylostoma caninum]